MILGETLNNWKIVGKIAAAAGIISVVFSVFAALIAYDNARLISAGYPPGYFSMESIMLSVLNAMLNPFLLYAALSFVVAWFATHAGNENEKPLLDEEKQQPPVEAQLETAKPEETTP